jgi:hypothetical protein
MRTWLVSAAALAAACGGGPEAPQVTAEASSVQAAQAFMRAARDSNLTRMGELWGTSRGAAGVTHSPPDYERRLEVLQAYLRGDSARVTTDMAIQGSSNRRRLVVSLFRSGCAKQVAMVAIRTKGGWLVNSVDLTSAGNPARPCEPG